VSQETIIPEAEWSESTLLQDTAPFAFRGLEESVKLSKRGLKPGEKEAYYGPKSGKIEPSETLLGVSGSLGTMPPHVEKKHDVSKPFIVKLHRKEAKVPSAALLQDPAQIGKATLTNNANTQYFGKVAVGTPAKEFTVVFDTGSSVLWVPDAQCKSEACKSHKQFSLHGSTTGVLLGEDEDEVKEATIQYGTGKMVGVEAQDVVRIGDANGLAMPKSGILLATQEEDAVFSNFPFDGVFGLNRRSVMSGGLDFNVMKAAKDSGSVKENIVAFWLGGAPGENGGAIAIGGVDQRFIETPMSWHPVTANEFGNWMLKLDSLKIGDVEVCPGGCTTIIDTGTSLLVASQKVHDKLAPAMPIDASCASAGSGKALTFTYNGKQFPLRPEDYTIEMVDDSGGKACSSAISAMEGNLLSKMDTIAPESDGRVIIMGDVFLRRVYTAFDNSNPDKPRVGFAMAKDAAAVDFDQIFAN